MRDTIRLWSLSLLKQYASLVIAVLLASPLPAALQVDDPARQQLEPSADLVFGTSHLRGAADCTTFTPDGKLVVTAGNSNEIQFWDPATGLLVKEWTSQENDYHAITYSPDGKLLAVGGGNGKLAVWDVEAEQEIFTRNGETELPQLIISLAFSPDSKRLACGTREDRTHIWDVASGEHLATLSQDRVRDDATVVWSPDGALLVVGIRGMVYVYDSQKYEELRRFIAHDTFSTGGLEFVSNTELLTAASRWLNNGSATPYRAEIKIWEVPRARLLQTVVKGTEGTGVRASRLSPDGTKLIVRGVNDLEIISLEDGSSLAKFARLLNTSPYPQGFALSPDGNLLAMTDRRAVLQLYDLRTQQRLLEPHAGHDDALRGLAVSPDGSRLATLGGDCEVHIWDTQTAEIAQSYFCGVSMYPRTCVWSHDGRYLYVAGNWLTSVAGQGGFVLAFEAATGEMLFQTGVSQIVDGSALSQDGEQLAVAVGMGQIFDPREQPETYIGILDAQTGRALQRVPPGAADSGVYGKLKFSADGERLQAMSRTRGATIDTWDLRSGTLMLEDPLVFLSYSDIAVASPRVAISTAFDTIEILDTEKMTQVSLLHEPNRRYRTVTLSADGKWLATTSQITRIEAGRQRSDLHPLELCVWNIETRELVHHVPDLQHACSHLEFSPDNTWLYGASSAGIAVGWDLSEVTQ